MIDNMVTVIKEFTFDSAHWLPDYVGPCNNMHGHTYKLQVGLQGEVKRETGMVVDFGEVKSIIKPLVDAMDHSVLNDLSDSSKSCYMPGFPRKPTAENMVLWLAERIRFELVAKDVRVTLVRLWETPTSYAEWTE